MLLLMSKFMAPQSERHCQFELSWEVCEEETFTLDKKKHKGQMDVWQRKCRKSSGFHGLWRQMGLNSSAVCFGTYSICWCDDRASGVFRCPKSPIGFKSVITAIQSWMSSLITSFPVMEYTSFNRWLEYNHRQRL